MFDQVKIPFLATVILMLLFIVQGFWTIKLNIKSEQNKDIAMLAKKSAILSKNLSNLDNQNSLIYEFALYDSNENIITSKLSKNPPNLNFQVLVQNGFIYYKTAILQDQKTYFLVVAKQQNWYKIGLISTLIFIGTIILVFISIYFIYQSTLKIHQRQKKMMNSFFNDAMHELKTPLGVATLNLDMLEIRNKNTHRIKSALKQMKMTYEDVEFFIKHSYENFPKKPINFSYFLEQRVRFLTTIANSKDIKIISKIEPNLEIFMSEIELTRLSDNNISNAIKYSKSGNDIEIYLTKEDGFVVFSVKDYGKGIKDTKAIWQRYAREDLSAGGFGLGLNIVANICNKYNIIYSVSSVLGKGSTFTYKIPAFKEKLIDKLNTQSNPA
ncbi:sensor histidine kinase [Campylobacter hyointestinalis]|uniref:sensor histidine kinase n=1 Tax=Campylobacter hyointestinalis TaxID=198 RepID=UPI0025571AF8|nr:HAMP domain-containing sensor histidine kinase [Campylobacter hyointestinalis]MDL2347649.1 HAMP domain-containing sensor histidine kinase [Campylobacter hyointestinalis]MDL2349392.1 HAMP domain-containing sensor histidine kinase [Campylobacter hyointestinalis]MDL2351075.1 HAMP domain-containing sensor histidine kinase [Campylobacter hyointestinalis]MDM1026969.1 HAMP domain-containing sensor histidine kinase [Campylobacter hyointestinalis]MDM1028643.1 HAMP domain-containing sensor histidine 